MTTWETYIVVVILAFALGYISGSDKFDDFTGNRGKDKDDTI